MDHFSEAVSESIGNGWAGIGDVLARELHRRNGLLTLLRRRRYKSLAARLRAGMRREAGTITAALAAILAEPFRGEAVNRALYLVILDAYLEGLLHLKRHHATGPDGLRVASPRLLALMSEILDREETTRGYQPSLDFWRGVARFLGSDLPGAFALFEVCRARHFDTYGHNRLMMGGRTLIGDLDRVLGSEPKIAVPPQLDVVAGSPADCRETLVLLSCCDEVYLRTLGGAFFDALTAIGDDVRLHLHVARKTTGAIDLDIIPVSLRHKVDITSSDARFTSDKSWYTVIRWLIAHRLLVLYDRPLLVTDFDVKIRCDALPEYMEKASSFDLGLNINQFPANHVPWNAVNANQVYFANTEPARNFAGLLRETTLRWFDPHKPDQWWIDQNILYACHASFRQVLPAARILDNLSSPAIKTIMKDKREYLPA